MNSRGQGRWFFVGVSSGGRGGEVGRVEKEQGRGESAVAGWAGKTGTVTVGLNVEEMMEYCFGFLQRLAFTIPALERVTIGCCEVGGGGWLGMVLIVELEVLIVELFIDLFVGLFVVVFVEENWSHGAEGKDSFVKCDMTRNDNFVGVQVKAPVSAMIVRVPEKDRWCGTRGEFMWWKGVRVTKALNVRR
nr:hypothetical protein [Tanacetum cinerariifolium]